MSYETLREVAERDEHLVKGHGKLVPLGAALIAVLAALGTLFAQHRSIQALSLKNEAILAQSQSADLYALYQARRTRSTLYSALVAAGVARDATARDGLAKQAQREQIASMGTLQSARELEQTANREQERSEQILRSFETLEVATTLFEIAIVLVSISAISETPALLFASGSVTTAGVVFLVVGLMQSH